MRGRRTGEMRGAGAKKEAVAKVADTTEEVVDSEGEELDGLRVGGGDDINIGHVTATNNNNVGGTKPNLFDEMISGKKGDLMSQELVALLISVTVSYSTAPLQIDIGLRENERKGPGNKGGNENNLLVTLYGDSLLK
jgi:hypothetical protein